MNKIIGEFQKCKNFNQPSLSGVEVKNAGDMFKNCTATRSKSVFEKIYEAGNDFATGDGWGIPNVSK